MAKYLGRDRSQDKDPSSPIQQDFKRTVGQFGPLDIERTWLDAYIAFRTQVILEADELVADLMIEDLFQPESFDYPCRWEILDAVLADPDGLDQLRFALATLFKREGYSEKRVNGQAPAIRILHLLRDRYGELPFLTSGNLALGHY